MRMKPKITLYYDFISLKQNTLTLFVKILISKKITTAKSSLTLCCLKKYTTHVMASLNNDFVFQSFRELGVHCVLHYFARFSSIFASMIRETN